MDKFWKFFLSRYDEALLKYLLLAELGYEVAQSNAAYILDRYWFFQPGVTAENLMINPQERDRAVQCGRNVEASACLLV